MNKKRKRPNWIDIAFLVVIAAVALAAYLISHQNSEAVASTVTRSVVIEITEVAPEAANTIAAGDVAKEITKNQVLGTVTSVEVAPMYEEVFDEDAGICRRAEVPGKATLLVTIQADTLETPDQISAASGFPLRIGTGVMCTIGGFYGTGHIVGVDR